MSKSAGESGISLFVEMSSNVAEAAGELASKGRKLLLGREGINAIPVLRRRIPLKLFTSLDVNF